MTWLSPAFLFGLLALALPLALHLLRRRVVGTRPFPSLRFLAPNRTDQRKHQLRRRIVLSLRCLALALLAFAFARPFFGPPPSADARAIVVVIDNSFSLQTLSRWPELLRWARREIGMLSPGDSLGLLLMNPQPTWLLAPTRDTSTALATLDTLRPGWESTRSEPALRFAADVLAVTPARERRIIFLGDHQELGWTGVDFTKKLPPGVTASFPSPPAAPTRQAALTTAALAKEGDATVLSLTVQNFTTAHARTLSVYSENTPTPLHRQPLELSTKQSLSLKLALPALASKSTPPAYLRVSLDPDDLPADDTAWAVAPSARNDRLILLDRPPASTSPPADFVSTACTALSSVPPFLRLAQLPKTPWPVPAVAILRNDDSFTGESASRLDTFLKTGGAALLFFDGAPAQRAWLGTHGAAPVPLAATPAQLRDWTLDHPLIAPLAEHNLGSFVGWSYKRAWSLPANAVEPLAFWADGTIALGELRIGSGRVLVAGFSSDRRDGDWPLQPAFVPFLHRAAIYLLGQAAASTDAPLRVGTALPATPTPGTWLALAEPTTTLTHVFPRPGVYAFTAPGSPRRLYAVGLAPEESDPALWTNGTPWLGFTATEKTPAPSTRAVAPPPPDSENQSALWWWALAAMALFSLGELILANRTAR